MKLLLRNQAYRVLSLSRFFNAFGAYIFNLVFVVYASTLPEASVAVAMANVVMMLPTLFTVFVGIRADYTKDKVKWMTYVGLFQAVLFFLAALVVQQASFFAFSTLCLINVISDVASDFAGGLRMPLVKEKVAESDPMEAYSFSQFITYISAIGGQAFGVWVLGVSTQNFSLVAGINAIFFLVSARDYILNTIINNYSPTSTVLISTHLISDIEPILDEIIFLKDGKVVRQGNVDDIRYESGESIDQLFRHEFKA